MSDIMDFDAAFDESQQTGHPFRNYGRDYVLPPTPPLAFMLLGRVIEGARKGTDNVELHDVVRLLQAIFGKEPVDYWIERGMGTDRMEALVQWAMGKWSKADKDDTPPTDESEDPTTASTLSWPTGI